MSQRPLANLDNRGIEGANYTLARTNRLLIFGLTSDPYYGNPEGADAVVGCPRVGADFRGVDVLLRGCVVNLAQLWIPAENRKKGSVYEHDEEDGPAPFLEERCGPREAFDSRTQRRRPSPLSVTAMSMSP